MVSSNKKNTYILSIALNRPLWKQYDYTYQAHQTPTIGLRVQITFGFSQAIGIIIEIKSSSPFKQLKPINQLLDKSPLLDKKTFKQLAWISHYYFYPLGPVLFNALPAMLRKGRALPTTTYWTCSQVSNETIQASLKRAKKQLALFNYLSQCPEPVSDNTLTMELGIGWQTFANALVKKKLIQKDTTSPPSQIINPLINEQLTLTDEQNQCVEEIIAISQHSLPKPILLHGITGSGKTEVYLRVMRPLIEQHKQILVLVPEIGLTPQLYARFRQYFVNSHITMMHSKLSDSERLQAWHSAQTGKADILIGTRSAVFSPLPQLAMIIIDEEHDQSLKQQTTLRYHARDVAVKRAYDEHIPIILGSATPSIESIHNAQRKHYHYLSLKSRPGTRKPPIIQPLDIRGLTLQASLSNPLIKQIKQHLEANSQVMLFLNRRGFAPTLFCPNCGWYAECKNCDNKLTYHALSQQLRCHYCTHIEKVMDHCPSCMQANITTRGAGTERLEHYLSHHFPHYPIIRIDRDSTSKKGSLQDKLDQINENKPCIIIGTQMLAKGHDFPNLTLVGILDIDMSLLSTDFRATEYLAQLILQVSGRAGRAEKKGVVYMQTSQPQHPFFKILLTKGYLPFIDTLIKERKNWLFPPFSHQALIRANALASQEAIQFLDQLKEAIGEHQSSDIMILGPTPSPMEKRANRYRSQLLISTKTRGQRTYLLKHLLGILNRSRHHRVKWSFDIDPTNYE